MLEKFKSRKFILAIFGALLALANAFLEANGMPSIDTDKMLTILTPIIGYILGESFVDGANRR